MSHGYDGLFEKWELRIARRLIRKFQSKWPCLQKEQRDDLMQECLSHWHFTKSKYNPKREASPEGFMVRVFETNSSTWFVSELPTRRRQAISPCHSIF